MNSSENDFLNHIVNSLSNSLLFLDETNKIIWLNTTAESFIKNLLGVNVSVGDSFIDILVPQHQKALIKNVQKVRAHENVYRETLLNFNGKPVWYASEIKAIENDGQFLGTLIESYEITKAKKTQRENILAGATLNAIKNTSNDTSVLISTDKKVLWFNNLFEENVKRFIGVSPIVGGDMMSYVVDSIKENFTLYFDKAINGEHIEVDNELAISPDLAEWFSLDFYPVYNSSSNLLGVFFSARNINNRVRDKEKIIETNTKLKAIIDNTADNYILFDTNLNIVLANKSANHTSLQIHGRPLKEGTNITDYYISGITDRFIENSKRVFKGEIVEYEEEIKIGESLFWEQYRLFPVHNDTGEVNYLAFISNDISELKKNYHQLLIERKLFNKGPVVAFKWSLYKKGSITKYVSSNVEDVFGYTIDEILGKSFTDFIHPIDVATLKTYVSEWNATSTDTQASPYLDISYRVGCKDGSYKWVNDYSFLTEEPNGEKLVCGYLIDITEQKKVLIDLEETNSQLKSALTRVNTQSKILEVTTNIIVLTDVEGKITWVNDAFEKCTQYTLDEVLGKKPGALLQGPETDAKTVKFIRDCILEEKKVKTEILNYKKNGEKYWLEISIEPIYDETGVLTAFLAIESDITERKRIDRKLKERDERLKKFSFITSHELRHEFAKILLLLENKELLLEEALGELDVLTEIETAANAMNDIISKMNNQLYISDTSEELAHKPSLTTVEEVCLIDDDEIVCFINTKLIKMSLPDKKVVAFQNVDDALEYIKATPQIQRYIFLDLNMPYKTGWDFLEEYKPPSISSPVILLTSSIDDTDREKSKNYPQVISFLTKPLTTEKLEVFIR